MQDSQRFFRRAASQLTVGTLLSISSTVGLGYNAWQLSHKHPVLERGVSLEKRLETEITFGELTPQHYEQAHRMQEQLAQHKVIHPEYEQLKKSYSTNVWSLIASAYGALMTLPLISWGKNNLRTYRWQKTNEQNAASGAEYQHGIEAF